MGDCSNGFFNKYPYTNYHELNLDYIMEQINSFNKRIDELSDELVKNANIYTDEKFYEIAESEESEQNEMIADLLEWRWIHGFEEEKEK